MTRLFMLLIALMVLQGCQSVRGVATAGDTNGETGAAVVSPPDPPASAADIEASEALRRAILADPAMSVDARNIFVSTLNGNMTLRGVVNDDTERAKIRQIAARLAAVKAVTDELQLSGGTSEADSPIRQGGGDVKTRSQAGR